MDKPNVNVGISEPRLPSAFGRLESFSQLTLRLALLGSVCGMLSATVLAQEPAGKTGETEKPAAVNQDLSLAPAKVDVNPVARDEEIRQRRIHSSISLTPSGRTDDERHSAAVFGTCGIRRESYRCSAILIARATYMVCNSYRENVSLAHSLTSDCWFVHGLGIKCAIQRCWQSDASRAARGASAVHGGQRHPASQ